MEYEQEEDGRLHEQGGLQDELERLKDEKDSWQDM